MRYSIAILALFIITGMFSCKKDSSSASIAGKWNIVSDSTSSSGVGSGNGSSGHTYTGMSGDYFEFTSQGSFSANEGNILSATGTYTFNKSLINIKYSKLVSDGATIENASGNYTVSSVSANKLVLTNRSLTPGGSFYEEITLSK